MESMEIERGCRDTERRREREHAAGREGTVEGRVVYENGFEAKFGGLASLQRKLPLHALVGLHEVALSRIAGADFTAPFVG